jgi:uncharacterized protein (DUF302 family)
MHRFSSVLFAILVLFIPHVASAADSAGLNVRSSAFDFETTLRRVHAEIEARGATIVATVRHSDAAQSVGLPLPPTAVVIFGNPRLGTQLMQMDQRIGIDLPLRILVMESAGGEVTVAYRPAEAIVAAHDIDAAQLVNAMNTALEGIASAASR